MTKLETLLLQFSEEERSIVGLENLKNLKKVKLSGWKNYPPLERAVERLKVESENRPKSNQIKVVVRSW